MTNEIVPNYYMNVKNKGSKILLPAHGWAGQTQLPYRRRISQNEIRNSAAAESEGGQKSESLIVVGCPGIEPGTSYLSGKRSTDELAALGVKFRTLSGRRPALRQGYGGRV